MRDNGIFLIHISRHYKNAKRPFLGYSNLLKIYLVQYICFDVDISIALKIFTPFLFVFRDEKGQQQGCWELDIVILIKDDFAIKRRSLL